MTPGQIKAAFRAACADELHALKPGNVHVHAAGHRMTVADFQRSAEAAAGPLCAAGASLGARIHGAIAATRAAVGQNTNLGIVLLCAPLAMAAEQGGDLQAALRRVLAASGLDDAAAGFAAIALAAPGGLGEAARHDVRAPASVTLPEAMREAAARDSVARQYATGFADVFGELMAAFAQALGCRADRGEAILALYLRCLARWPDSHMVRRHGAVVAEALRRQAAAWVARLDRAGDAATLVPALLVWDAELKRDGLNPGTSADLTVATIFAHRLRNSLP